MPKYFNNFPKTYYSLDDDSTDLNTATNIITRFSFMNGVKEQAAVFYEYDVQDGDTPEIIASKFYDHPERHWIVLMFNDIIDTQYDWPLQYNTFIEYVDKKYHTLGQANTTPQTGLAWAMSNNNVHSYYYTKTRTNSDSVSITEVLQVDANTYANISVSTVNYTLSDNTTIQETVTKNVKSYYTHERELNDSKRKIKLIKKEYVTQIEKEFKKSLK
jgi:hypothetical protein